jgi:hypothetical protein
MEAHGAIFVVLLFLVLAILLIVWHFSRSNDLLHGWAHENGLRIVRQEYRHFFKGPFFWTTSKGQTVYYVTVKDDNGNQRNGWVRCGGWFFGLLSNNVDVRWDDELGRR